MLPQSLVLLSTPKHNCSDTLFLFAEHTFQEREVNGQAP